MSPRVPFALVQVLGGAAVLGSYAWGLATHPDSAAALWGTIPEAWWTPYSLCMPPAALGYLAATGVLFRCLPDLEEPGRLTALYAVFLATAAAWMPLCFLALDRELPGLWWAIQGVLAGTALAALGIARELWGSRETLGSTGFRIAAVGWAFLCWQVVVLDALVWPRFFAIPA